MHENHESLDYAVLWIESHKHIYTHRVLIFYCKYCIGALNSVSVYYIFLCNIFFKFINKQAKK